LRGSVPSFLLVEVARSVFADSGGVCGGPEPEKPGVSGMMDLADNVA
jgi:hypothetical protein